MEDQLCQKDVGNQQLSRYIDLTNWYIFQSSQSDVWMYKAFTAVTSEIRVINRTVGDHCESLYRSDPSTSFQLLSGCAQRQRALVSDALHPGGRAQCADAAAGMSCGAAQSCLGSKQKDAQDSRHNEASYQWHFQQAFPTEESTYRAEAKVGAGLEAIVRQDSARLLRRQPAARRRRRRCILPVSAACANHDARQRALVGVPAQPNGVVRQPERQSKRCAYRSGVQSLRWADDRKAARQPPWHHQPL